MESEAASHADFTILRYAQVWEDADILIQGLAIQPDDVCLSIASAGDNALSLIGAGARRVVALDLNPAQLAALELRVAAFRTLEHGEILELAGSSPSERRLELYFKCRDCLSPPARIFWEARHSDIQAGIGQAGKFERYFKLFRTRIIPWIHNARIVDELLKAKPRSAREAFYEKTWNNWRWQLLFRFFFSRTIMGRMGRDPSFFRYVEGSVAEKILSRTRHALTELDPSANPYLQWILKGRHLTALPHYLRPENFEKIRAGLPRLEWRQASVEAFLSKTAKGTFSKFNLSDIFEYMSADQSTALLEGLITAARSRSRIAYWNMLAPRNASEALRGRIQPLTESARTLHLQDKAFFYSAFVLEEIQ
ncbi:MAG TPA: DUF3419 family protein [Chthoniobacterales bacterium]